MKDVADLAGVSYTTVSHVINRTRPVAPETRLRVENAIARIGFLPNRTARSLKKGSTRTIGVITTSPEDLFFMEAMHGAFSVFGRENYDLYFCFSKPEGEWNWDRAVKNEIGRIDAMLSRGVEAFIINSISPDAVVRDFVARTGRPFALFQRSMPGTGCCTVVSDDFDGGYRAVSHLASLGRERIAVFYGYTFETHAAAHRRTGAERAMKDAGLRIDPELWIDIDYDVETAYRETRRLLGTKDRPDAIFYYSDLLAIAGLRAASDCGVRVPEELAVVGYDNIVQCEYSIPRLSSVNQRKFEMGTIMAEKLLAKIGNPQEPSGEITLPVDLVVRESSDPGAAAYRP